MSDALGQFDRTEIDLAIKTFTQARAIFEREGDPGEALQADFWIGPCYDVQEDARRSISILNRLVRDCEENDFLWLQAAELHGMAMAYTAHSQSSFAINLFSSSH